MKRIRIALLAGALLAIASCSKNNDTTSTPNSTVTAFTLYGYTENDVVTVDTFSRRILYQGQILPYTISARTGSSVSVSVSNSATFGWVANAVFACPSSGGVATLQIQGNQPTVFGSTEYVSH
jgi:hypothetical protein